MRELSKRNRSQAVKFDPSSDQKKKRKVKKLKMVPEMEGNWIDQMHKAHRLKNTKMHKEKKKLVRKKGRNCKHVLEGSADSNAAMKKGSHGHFVMNGLCRLERTNKAPSKLKLLSVPPHRIIRMPLAENAGDTGHTLSRPTIPSPKPDHPIARRTIQSPKPEHTLSRPLIPTPKTAVFEKVYSTFSINTGNAGNSRSRRLLSPNSLKRSYAFFANSPLMQNNISSLSKTPVTVKLESPNILNAFFANSPLTPVTVKLESSDSLRCSLLTNPSIIQKNISQTPVASKQESPKTCELQQHSSLIISPFEIKKTPTPKSTADLLEYLFKSPHILSFIPSRDNPGNNKTETDASSTATHTLEYLQKKSFPLVLHDPLMPELI